MVNENVVFDMPRLDIYLIPRMWVYELTNKSIYPFRHLPMANFTDGEFFVTTKEDAIQICRSYLKIMDKNWWPTLLGKNEIMDMVLAEEFGSL